VDLWVGRWMVNGVASGWVRGLMLECTNGWAAGCMVGGVSWTSGWVDVWMVELDGWISGRVDKWTGG
jgi:hypothetical protein